MSDGTNFARYLHGSFRPYLRAAFTGEAGLTAIEAGQPAGDFSDPPSRNIVVVQTKTGGSIDTLDYGLGGFRDRRYEPENISVIPRGAATKIVMSDPHVVRAFELPVSVLEPTLALLQPKTEPLDFGRLHMEFASSRTITNLLDHVWEEGSRDDVVGRMFVESAVLSVGIALAREATRSSERSVRTWKTADDRLRRAVEYCESHLADDLSLCDVAEVVALSAPHLASLFRTAYGVPPHRWLMGRRVEKARSLLKNPSLTITDVALACGFASSQHFARVFRRFVNTTPTEYRRQCLS